MRSRARKTVKSEECAAFKAFWDEVWKPHMNPNDGRGAARDEFIRHVEEYGADPQDILDGARWFIHKGGNQRISSDGTPVQQHAASWLNKRAYEDGADDWRDLQSRIEQSRQQPQNVVQMPERRHKTPFMLKWEREHPGEDYFAHFDKAKRRSAE